MALARQRLLTLAYEEMETVRVVSTYPLCPSAFSKFFLLSATAA